MRFQSLKNCSNLKGQIYFFFKIFIIFSQISISKTWNNPSRRLHAVDDDARFLIYIYIYICVCIYIYILYIYFFLLSIYLYIHLFIIHFIYLYLYISRVMFHMLPPHHRRRAKKMSKKFGRRKADGGFAAEMSLKESY